MKTRRSNYKEHGESFEAHRGIAFPSSYGADLFVGALSQPILSCDWELPRRQPAWISGRVRF